jgi:hypothetical protein
VGCDTVNGTLWTITPEYRADNAANPDNEQFPIISIISGLYSARLRNSVDCFRAVVVASQGEPVAAGVGIQLRTSDDSEHTWQNHGLLVMDEFGRYDYDIAWASLGLISNPGRVFEITDTGYAARIDALDIDVGPEQSDG